MLVVVLIPLFLLPLVALAFTLLNAVSWSRPRAAMRPTSAVSVLIPARDEERVIEACVRAALRSVGPSAEVLVYDDGSTDQTRAILKRLARGDERLRVLTGPRLPAGWVGKAHACHQLAAAARGEVLAFVDADVRLEPGGVGGALAAMDRQRADVLSAFPRQETRSFSERLIVPLLHLSLTSFLPLVLVGRSRDARVVAASGQLLLVRRRAYDRLGGFCAIKDALVDDIAFCRRAKEVGLKVVFTDGHHLARCRMYTSAREVLHGFSKNLYAGLGARWWRLLLVLALYFGCFLAPWLALAAGPWIDPAVLLPASLGVVVNVTQRCALIARHHHPLSGALLHPLSILVFMGIALSSWRWHAGGAVRWRGRAYAVAGATTRPTKGALTTPRACAARARWRAAAPRCRRASRDGR